ncbi:MAG TPA: LEA type 2 family protein [bacterium]|nr:LEA type 2 family protein [bacterium]HPN33859.1 LEA type 2 family protein [bacterium]
MRKRWSLFLAIGLLGWSCVGLNKLVQTPTLQVDDVAVTSLDFEKIGLDFVFRVHNPNTFAVSLSALDYTLVVDGNTVLAGQENRSITLAGRQDNLVHFPVALLFSDIRRFVSENENMDSLSYRLSGSLAPAGVLSGVKIPFNKSGRVPNLRLPRLSLNYLQIRNLTFSGADLLLVIGLQNPNSVPFKIAKWDYSLSLAGQALASGVSQKPAEIPAHGLGEIELPVSIDPAGALSSAVSVLMGQSVQAALNGKMELATPFGEVVLPLDAQTTLKIIR